MSNIGKYPPVSVLPVLLEVPEKHAAPSILLEQVHSNFSIVSITQQSPGISEAPVSNGSSNSWIDEFQPLEKVTRTTVPTDQAAYYLNRRPQTLRSWASLENGPIIPIRINGRLAWSVFQMRAILAGESNE